MHIPFMDGTGQGGQQGMGYGNYQYGGQQGPGKI